MEDLKYKIIIFYEKLCRFFYYGYHGTKTFEFCADSMDVLIAAHIKRVLKFMESDKTHLIWNDDRDTKGMRLLREFNELCQRKVQNGDRFNPYYFAGQVNKKHGRSIILSRKTSIHRKEFRRAMKKDHMIEKQLQDRYHYLLRKHVPTFWD